MVEDMRALRTVLVSCTDKRGLVSNTLEDGSVLEGVPEDGILGLMSRLNDTLFIATGGTCSLIQEAGLRAMEVAEYTGYPEMASGLVKSLHPAIQAGILAQPSDDGDERYMREQGFSHIDAVVVNFYDLARRRQETGEVEMLRQAIDVGGPTMAHGARKSFIKVAVITSSADYAQVCRELTEQQGSLGLATRLALAQKASRYITQYMQQADDCLQELTSDQLKEYYGVE